jgi:hypothetical protein
MGEDPNRARRFVPVVGYAIAWRFLNVLYDHYAESAGSGLLFLCESGALDRRGESRDRDCIRAWRDFVDGRRALSLIEIYGLLLQMLDAFMEHGAEPFFRDLRARLNATTDGLPTENELRRWWLRAARDVERDLESGFPFRGTNPVRLNGITSHGSPILERLTRDEEMAMYRRMGEVIP